MLRTFVYVLQWLLLMGVAIFATQNTLTVSLKFLTLQSINLPLGLVLVFSAGLGAVAITMIQVARSNQPQIDRSSTRPFSYSSASTPPPKTSTNPFKPNQKVSKKSDEFEDNDDWDWD